MLPRQLQRTWAAKPLRTQASVDDMPLNDDVCRCEKCTGPMPCREHPAAPKLSLVGGTDLERSTPAYPSVGKYEEQIKGVEAGENSGNPDSVQGSGNEQDGAGGVGQVAAQPSPDAAAGGADVRADDARPIPLRVAQAISRLAAGAPAEPAKKVDEITKATVERLLERIKSGEVNGVAIVEAGDGRVATYWTGGSYHHLNSGAATLAARIALADD